MEFKGSKKVQRSKQEMIIALETSLGVVTRALEIHANISRSGYYLWLREDFAFAKAVDVMLDIKRDFVEGKMLELIKENNAQAIISANKSLNRQRGYGDNVDITSNDEPISIKINLPK